MGSKDTWVGTYRITHEPDTPMPASSAAAVSAASAASAVTEPIEAVWALLGPAPAAPGRYSLDVSHDVELELDTDLRQTSASAADLGLLGLEAELTDARLWTEDWLRFLQLTRPSAMAASSSSAAASSAAAPATSAPAAVGAAIGAAIGAGEAATVKRYTGSDEQLLLHLRRVTDHWIEVVSDLMDGDVHVSPVSPLDEKVISPASC